KRFGAKHNAVAVDMECAVVARACTEAGIPFGCVRAISDEADNALSPHIASLLAGEHVSLPRVIMAIVRQPALLPELLRLAGDTRGAAENRAEGLIGLLPLPAKL